ncbi:U3 snoRNP-associated protein Utp3 [Schizosaccharomyces cryophilus OY26]|uniref:U3 snoRNP-associated protein Utp3 n=1 Tax=Schizosaccharomyces cryophilus (strain OY26 / ATCC MYA-4695 / CBS 11777 / NBRC 106824 / NRRL Y48691) TaxID=653667 RepID=S9VWY2_SCHCR|nr:U3 snoRNP-associated protein Utp3 [Schizosaccharomyces cryophilus OY26]EPY50450.1 U3 snoRNP-associated protein Utp3 [Schizosaccharomyces cryophilus OY26]
MARKKSRSNSVKNQAKNEQPVNERETVDAIRTYDDVADSEDEFYKAQDKILFDGDSKKNADEDKMSLSDEEVLGLEGSSDEDGEEAVEGATSDEDELTGQNKGPVDEEEVFDEKGWGRSAKSYYGGDDYDNENYDEDDEEFDARMEEQEALRLQRKRLEKMTEEDAVDDISQWADKAKVDSSQYEDSLATVEQLDQKISPTMPRSELLKILRTKNPEFELFLEEYKDLKPSYEELKGKLDAAPTSLLQAQVNALGAYIAFLAFYFALLRGGEEDIKNHPIMTDLVRCKQTWESFRDLDDIQIPTPESPEEQAANDKLVDGISETHEGDQNLFDEDESAEESDREEPDDNEEASSGAEENEDREDDITSKFREAKAKGVPKSVHNVGDYGEGLMLDSMDAEEKATKRRSLRFYANQIDQKAAKRSRAQTDLSGDVDIPYKERLYERRQRLLREAAARGQDKAQGADLDEEEPENEGLLSNKDRENDTTDQDALDYYNSISSQSKGEKRKRKEDHDYERDLVRASRNPELFELGEGDKRGITRDIATNRGLTPRRPKENRNPRLKKRMRYEKAKKKLGSKKAIYKGPPKHNYGGEETGIKAGLVKSIKFQ